MSNTETLWPLEPGGALTRWLISEAEEIHYPGEPRAMPDRVDYRFRNGFVDVGDLPCREAWLHSVASDAELSNVRFKAAYCCDASLDIDFSTFRTQPTLIRRFLQTLIMAEKPGPAVFEVKTCGRLQIWHGSTPQTQFAPRTRNVAKTKHIELQLREGAQTITVLLEELHERDTLCLMSMRLVRGEKHCPILATSQPGAHRAGL